MPPAAPAPEALERLDDRTLLNAVLLVYADALDALGHQDTPALQHALSYRHALLTEVKARALAHWPGHAKHPELGALCQAVREAEAQFIKALDQNIRHIKSHIHQSHSQSQAAQAYTRRRRA